MNQSAPENSYPTNNGTSSHIDDENVSLVHQPPQTHEVAYAIYESLEPSEAEKRPQWLNSLLTPWSLGSLLLILSANSLLSWAKWTDSYTPQTLNLTPSTAIVSPPANIDISDSLKLTSDQPVALSLDSLSTTTLSKTKAIPQNRSSKQSKKSKPQKIAISKVPAKPISTVTPKTDLSSALLPPSLKPQLVPVNTIPQPPSPTVLVKTPAPSSITISDRPEVVRLPPKPLSNQSTVDPATMRTVNERILEEMRLREEQRQNMPFIEKAKAQKQAIQSRQNLNQVLDQMEQQQPQQTTIPNTLVIDGRNPENNTNQ